MGQTLQHYFYFPEHTAAHAAAGALESLGYSVEVRHGAFRENWLVRAEHSGTPGGDKTEECEKLAQQYGGEYDGWENSVEG